MQESLSKQSINVSKNIQIISLHVQSHFIILLNLLYAITSLESYSFPLLAFSTTHVTELHHYRRYRRYSNVSNSDVHVFMVFKAQKKRRSSSLGGETQVKPLNCFCLF